MVAARANPSRRASAGQEAEEERDKRQPLGPAAGLWVYAGEPQVPDGADGAHGAGGGRLDGHGYAALGAVVEAKTAAHLFQAELRAGDEPAARFDPRGTRDE